MGHAGCLPCGSTMSRLDFGGVQLYGCTGMVWVPRSAVQLPTLFQGPNSPGSSRPLGVC